MNSQNFKSGFVTLLGRPNVGKSTLLNKLIGQQISITANKPQTTRNNIRGIITEEDYQAIILDTPGIHLPKNELHRRIVNYATKSIEDSDLIFFLTEPIPEGYTTLHKGDLNIIEQFKQSELEVVLVINKIDMSGPDAVLRTISLLNEQYSFKETVPISALKGKGVDILKSFFSKYLPAGIPYFDEDQMTDTPERAIVAEFVREQIMRLCFQEVPYGAAVMIDAFKEEKQKINIFATVFVEKETHKRIIIGKQGSMLKKVGTQARQKIEKLLGANVYLSLHVKVSKNWINNPRKLSEFGYSDIKE